MINKLIMYGKGRKLEVNLPYADGEIDEEATIEHYLKLCFIIYIVKENGVVEKYE